MKEDLKSCPFCGGSAAVENGPAHIWYVQCKDCGIDGRIGRIEKEAIDAWNRRAAASSQQEMGSNRLTADEILRRAEGLKFDDEGGADRLVDFVRSLSLPPASAQQDIPENWKELMSFYDADTPEAMVEAMEKHILQLQATVLKRGGYGQQVETKVREG